MSKSNKNSATTLDLDPTTPNTEEVKVSTRVEQIQAIEQEITTKTNELEVLKNEKKRLLILERVEKGDIDLINRLLADEGKSKKKKVGSAKPSSTVTESQVLEHITSTAISAADIAEKLTVDVASVSQVLKKLKEEGKIKSEGKARGVKYTLA